MAKQKKESRTRITNHFLIKSMPTGVYFTEKDCILNGKQIDITAYNFRQRVKAIDAEFKKKTSNGKSGLEVKFFLSERRKLQLLKEFKYSPSTCGAKPLSYTMKYNGVKTSFTNLSKLCRDNDLSLTCMTKVKNGTMTEHRGWTHVDSDIVPTEAVSAIPIDEINKSKHEYFLKFMSA